MSTIVTKWVKDYLAGVLTLDDLIAHFSEYPWQPARFSGGNPLDDSGPETDGSIWEIEMAIPVGQVDRANAIFAAWDKYHRDKKDKKKVPTDRQAEVAKSWVAERRNRLTVPSLPDLLASTRFSPRVTVAKAGPKNLVFGWASTIYKGGSQLFDHQGHAIDVDELEEAAYRFVENVRKTGVEHAGPGLGVMVESIVFTPEKIAIFADQNLMSPNFPVGWWVGFRVPPEVFARVQSGQLRMWSIQGGAVLDPVMGE